MIDHYDLTFPGSGPQSVCLRGSTNGGATCTPFQVNPGTLKNAIGLYNWTYAPTATTWRIQYSLEIVGWGTSFTTYFNGDVANTPEAFSATTQVTSITWTSTEAPFGFTFTYQIQQMFNKGDNTFATASITKDSSSSTATVKLNGDIPLNLLAIPSGKLGYWLYDPELSMTTTTATGPQGGASSSASLVSASFASIVVVVMALLR